MKQSVNTYYYDDPEGDALSPETCHPNFVKVLTEHFYYDCTDELSPFGNDDGADLLYNLEDWYREQNGKGSIVKWLFNTIDEFGFTYKSADCSAITDEETLSELQEEDPYFISSMDNAIIAAAFGQYKIAGEIDLELRQIALTALKRQSFLHTKNEEENVVFYRERLNQMSSDLERLDNSFYDKKA